MMMALVSIARLFIRNLCFRDLMEMQVNPALQDYLEFLEMM